MKASAYWILWLLGLALNVANAAFMLCAGVFELLALYADHTLASWRNKLSTRESDMWGKP